MQSFYLFIIQSQDMQSFVFTPHNRHWHHSTSAKFGRNLWIFQEIPWKLNLVLLQLNLSIVANFEVSWYKLAFSNIPRQKNPSVWGLGILEPMPEARIFTNIFLETRYPEIVVRNVQELHLVEKQLVACVHSLITAYISTFHIFI